MSNIEHLALRINKFAEDRDWEQFHTPKNLTMALAGEVGELIAEFQWLTPEESMDVLTADSEAAARIHAELGDVMIYLVRLSDVLGADLLDLADTKLAANEKRYPSAQYRGSARKAPS
jgi:NTP pyrophosphatase (non-canonical NTP hydrolase)